MALYRLVLLVAATLAGCAIAPGWPGYISESKSDFDGSRVVSVHPGSASGCCSIGATWSSGRPEQVQIDASITGGSYTSIQGIAFNIDGRIVQLPTTNLPTQFDSARVPGTATTYRSSVKSFVIPRADFDAMLAAKMLRVRLETTSGVREGDLLRDAITGSAIEGFKSFAKRLP